MKYYDKDIYETSKKLEMYIVIICMFLVGFILGYYIINLENEEEGKANNVNYIVSEEL